MKRTRLNPVSKRRLRRDRGYRAARREVYDRADGVCEARGSWACTGRVEQVHHIAGRVGPDPHRLPNLLGVCAPCHDHIHRYPEVSRRFGWMASRLSDAEGEAYGPGDVA